MDKKPGLDGEARELALKLTPVLEEQAGKPIYYSALMAPHGLTTEDPRDRSLIAHALAHVSRESWDKDGFMLSACVVKQDTQRPGNGFYELAVQLGAMEEGEDKEVFWVEQMKKMGEKYGKS